MVIVRKLFLKIVKHKMDKKGIKLKCVFKICRICSFFGNFAVCFSYDPSFILRLNINNVKKDDAWMNGGTKLQSVTICHGFNVYTHYFAYANSGSEII